MVPGVQIHTKVSPEAQTVILTDAALTFLADLHRTFESTRQSCLRAREHRQHRIDSGTPFEFLPETAYIRSDPFWLCASPAPGLEDRRVEIIAPPVRKMVVNALNCGANAYVADFEGTVSKSILEI